MEEARRICKARVSISAAARKQGERKRKHSENLRWIFNLSNENILPPWDIYNRQLHHRRSVIRPPQRHWTLICGCTLFNPPIPIPLARSQAPVSAFAVWEYSRLQFSQLCMNSHDDGIGIGKANLGACALLCSHNLQTPATAHFSFGNLRIRGCTRGTVHDITFRP